MFLESATGSSPISQLNHHMTELMDWYFGNATADELVVPKEQDLSDRLPSPDSWLQWGRSPSESFGSQNKYFVTETKPTREELNLDGMSLCDEVGMELYNQELEQSSGSSICGGLSGRSPHKTRRSHDRPDYQLDDLAEMDQMDDIFLSSLLEEEVPGMENFRGSFCSSSRPHCAMTPADNLLSDMILDSQSISGDLQGTGSSKYLKTHDFSPPVDWENGGVSDSHFIPCNMGQKVCPPVKALSELVLVPAELSSANECVYEETSVEESVLQDLEMVMAQLNEKTRICFRDALYRLAKNSKQNTTAHTQSGDMAFEKPQTSSRSVKTEARESETNTIDRAIANLMFSKMEYNAQDIATSSMETTGQQDYCSNQSQFPSSPHRTILQGDVKRTLHQ